MMLSDTIYKGVALCGWLKTELAYDQFTLLRSKSQKKEVALQMWRSIFKRGIFHMHEVSKNGVL